MRGGEKKSSQSVEGRGEKKGESGDERRGRGEGKEERKEAPKPLFSLRLRRRLRRRERTKVEESRAGSKEVKEEGLEKRKRERERGLLLPPSSRKGKKEKVEEKFLFSPPSSLPLSSFSHFVWVRGRREKLFRASSSYLFCFLLAPLACLLPFRKRRPFSHGGIWTHFALADRGGAGGEEEGMASDYGSMAQRKANKCRTPAREKG